MQPGHSGYLNWKLFASLDKIRRERLLHQVLANFSIEKQFQATVFCWFKILNMAA